MFKVEDMDKSDKDDNMTAKFSSHRDYSIARISKNAFNWGAT